MAKVTFAGYTIRLPHHPVLRITLGILLVICGFLGFLPILGFWMVPVGLVVLSIDFASVRRLRRKWTCRLGRWLKARHPKMAKALGFGLAGERA